jgi:tetratricopeptide (TPR) repeat protein
MERLENALRSGAKEEAAALVEALVKDHRDNLKRLLKVGRLCEKRGLTGSALIAFDAAIESARRQGVAQADIYLNAASARFRCGALQAALANIEQGVAALGPNADLFELRGHVLRAMNDIEGAAQSLEQALELRPGDAKLTGQLCRHLLAQAKYTVPGSVVSRQKYASAERRLIAVLETMRPGESLDMRQYRRLVIALVHALLNQYKFHEARDWLQGLLRLEPGDDEALTLLGHTLHHWGHFEDAEHHFQQALAINPDNPQALHELAELFETRGTLLEAERMHERLARVTGNSALNARNYSHVLLGQGKAREGWARNMQRIEATALARIDGIRVWDGSSLSGRSIFVIAEGGTGDELRDAACYKDTSEIAAHCTISCDPRLAPLFSRSFPRAQFWPLKRIQRVSSIEKMLSKLVDDEALEAMRRHDFCVLSPDLFYHLKPEPEDYGAVESFLVPDPSLRSHWRRRLDALGPGPKIGITWRSGTKLYRIDMHYTRLLDWGPVFALPGLHFVNLQYDECEEELQEAECAFGVSIHRWADTNLKDDFDSVAALSRELDLVIAPNTTNLELAGAVGGRALYLINKPQAIDYWRLKNHGFSEDRLYPGVRLLWADRPGDAASLISRLVDELCASFTIVV